MTSSNPAYVHWNHINQRCNNSNNADYKYYGARGIKVAEIWKGKAGFRRFVDDVYPKPEGMTLDRMDNNGDYSPDNVKWVTHKEQCNNRRSNNRVTDPKTNISYTLQQLSEKFGIKERTVRSRFIRGNKTFEQLTYRGHLKPFNNRRLI